MLAVAHRGFSAKYPENSSASYIGAIKANADLIETDVRLSVEGVPLAVHDASLRRLTGQNIVISQARSDDIKNTNRFDGESFLTTEQVLKIARNHIDVLLDIKSNDTLTIQRAFDVVAKLDMRDHVVFGLRDLAQIDFLHSLDSQIKTLGMPNNISEIDVFSEKNVDAIRIWEDWFDNIDISQPLSQIWMTAGKPIDREAGEITKKRLGHFSGKNIAAVLLNDPTLIVGAR